MTRDDGTFDVDPALPPGRMYFEVELPEGTQLRVIERGRDVAADSGPIELRVHVGPRYGVEIVGPVGVQDLEWSAQLLVV
ncbi:MAG: hypothetical protein GY711_14475 [bacterium]|nr:hypothetical protein [bacterium]